MVKVVENSREGQILMSIPGIGPQAAATLIAFIGNIANFERADSSNPMLAGFRKWLNQDQAWIGFAFRREECDK